MLDHRSRGAFTTEQGTLDRCGVAMVAADEDAFAERDWLLRMQWWPLERLAVTDDVGAQKLPVPGRGTEPPGELFGGSGADRRVERINLGVEHIAQVVFGRTAVILAVRSDSSATRSVMLEMAAWPNARRSRRNQPWAARIG